MPRQFESFEQGVAFLAWCLDRVGGDKLDAPATPAWWIEGRRHRHLLPWERELAAYEARPRCLVQREWVRVAMKALACQLAGQHDDTPVTCGFDGTVLTIRCAGQVYPMPGNGPAWTLSYSVRAGTLGGLPKRLMHPSFEVSIFGSAITIGDRRYQIMRYHVFPGDNLHAYDESDVDESRSFATPEEAIAAAKQIVDQSLRWERQQCEDPNEPAELYERYVDFGDSPVIRPDVEPRFSALGYANVRAADICKELFRKDVH